MRVYMNTSLQTIVLGLSIVMVCVTTVFGAKNPQEVLHLADNFFSDTLYSLAAEQYTIYLTLASDGSNTDKAAHARYRLAESSRHMQHYKDAARHYEKFIERYPRNDRIIDAMYYAGLSHQQAQNYKEATSWFSLVWDRYVGSITAKNALFRAAVCAQNAHEPKRAIQLYDTFLRKFPEDDDAKQSALSLIKLLMSHRDHAKATQVMEKAMKLDDSDRYYRTRLFYLKASLAHRMQSRDTALTFFSRMRSTGVYDFPERDTAYRGYISLLADAGNYDTSLELFALLDSIYRVKEKPAESSFLIAWATHARKADDWSHALSVYQRLLREYPHYDEKVRVYYHIAQCQAALGQFARSIETLRKIGDTKSAGDFRAKALRKIGDMYMEETLYFNAITVYQRYLDLDDAKDKDEVMYQIGEIYQSQQRYAAAIREYERLIREYPGSRLLYRSMFSAARCYEHTDNITAAISHYQYLIDRGVSSELTAEAKERLRYLKEFTHVAPDSALNAVCNLLVSPEGTSPKSSAYLRRMADIYATHLNRYEKAAALYSSILELDVHDTIDAHIYYQLGNAYEKLFRKASFESDTTDARKRKQQALEAYSRVTGTYGASDFADDAAFRHLMLSESGIGAFDAFVSSYPQSPYAPTVLFRTARYYEDKAQHQGDSFRKKALQAYTSIIDDFPAIDSIDAAFCGMARNYLELGKNDSAHIAMARLADTFPQRSETAQAVYLRGVIASRKNNAQESISLFKKVLYTFPSSAWARKARYRIARVQYASGKIYEALANYRIYVNDYPDAPHKYIAQLGVARCLAKLGNTLETITILQTLLSHNPPQSLKAEIHFMYARAALQRKDTTTALEHFNNVTQNTSEWPLDHRSLAEMAEFHFEAKIYERAGHLYRLLLENASAASDSIQAYKGYVASLFMEGAHSRAHSNMRDFKSRFGGNSPEYAHLVFHEGMYFLNANDYGKAQKRFHYILKKHESSDIADDAAYHRALCEYYDDNKDKALSLFREAIEKYPRSSFLARNHFKIGMIYHYKEKYVQAIDAFNNVVKDSTAAASVRFRAAHNAAVDYQRLSSWHKAAEMYKVIAREFPNTLPAWEIHTKIGFCLYQANAFADALPWFEKAKEGVKKENMPEVLYWSALCHQKLGNNEQALSIFLKIPYMYSGSGKWALTSEFKAAQIYERMGDHQKARKMYKRVIQSDGENGSFGKKAVERVQQLDAIIRDASRNPQ